MSALCVIPAKGGSKRLKNKNILELNGKPLVGLAVEKASQSEIFDEIVLSTEDAEIRRLGLTFGASVPFYVLKAWHVIPLRLSMSCYTVSKH